ncbi:MAG: SGNH/GDSL hydrolase family protein [Bdellovibrionota bacterium]
MKPRHYFLCSLVMLATGVELAARFAQPLLRRSTPAYYYRQYMDALLNPDPVFVWVGKPNAQAEIGNSREEKISYRLNKLGWRDKDFNPIEMPGNALVLGDSFSFGLGVKEEDRFSEVLEQYYRGLDVWNLGVMGYAPDQYLLLAERWLPPVPWTFLLVQLSNNDVSDVAQHTWKGINATSGIPAALEPPFSHRLVSGISEGWNLLAYFGILGPESKLPEDRLEDGLKRLLFSLTEIAKLARQRRIPLIVMQATDWGGVAYGEKVAGEYRNGVIQVAKDQGFALMEAGPQELLPMPDLHWTPAAHRKVADALSPEVFKILYPGKPFVTRKAP